MSSSLKLFYRIPEIESFLFSSLNFEPNKSYSACNSRLTCEKFKQTSLFINEYSNHTEQQSVNICCSPWAIQMCGYVLIMLDMLCLDYILFHSVSTG